MFDVPECYEGDYEEAPESQSPEEQQRAKWREYKRRERERKITAEQSKQEKTA